MTFRFHIVPGKTTPIYRQIVELVRTGVATGTLVEGDALPSVRALAAELVVNPNTVAKAYAELCREGVTESRRGRGMFVAARRQLLSRGERKRRLGEIAKRYVNEAVILGIGRDEAMELLEELWNPQKRKQA